MRIRAAASRMRMKEIAIKSHPIKSKLLVYETQVRNLRKRLRRDSGANVLTPPHSTPPPCCCLAASRPRDAPNVSQEQTNARGSRTTRAPSSGHVPAGGRERGGSRGAASPAPAALEGSAGGDGGFNFAAFVASMGKAPPAPAHMPPPESVAAIEGAIEDDVAESIAGPSAGGGFDFAAFAASLGAGTQASVGTAREAPPPPVRMGAAVPPTMTILGPLAAFAAPPPRKQPATALAPAPAPPPVPVEEEEEEEEEEIVMAPIGF